MDKTALAILVNLAQRVRMSRRQLRRVRHTGATSSRIHELEAQTREAWNAFQASKEVCNAMREAS